MTKRNFGECLKNQVFSCYFFLKFVSPSPSLSLGGLMISEWKMTEITFNLLRWEWNKKKFCDDATTYLTFFFGYQTSQLSCRRRCNLNFRVTLTFDYILMLKCIIFSLSLTYQDASLISKYLITISSLNTGERLDISINQFLLLAIAIKKEIRMDFYLSLKIFNVFAWIKIFRHKKKLFSFPSVAKMFSLYFVSLSGRKKNANWN